MIAAERFFSFNSPTTTSGTGRSVSPSAILARMDEKLSNAAQPKSRRRFQYSVRTLLIVVTLLAVPCAVVGWQAKFVRERLAVRHQFESVRVFFGSQTATNSVVQWFRNLLGDSYVFVVYIPKEGIDREDIKRMRAVFPEAAFFVLTPKRLTRVTD